MFLQAGRKQGQWCHSVTEFPPPLLLLLRINTVCVEETPEFVFPVKEITVLFCFCTVFLGTFLFESGVVFQASGSVRS